MRWIHSITCLFAAVILADRAEAQLLVGVELTDPDPGIGYDFGRAVTLAGDHAFVAESGEGSISISTSQRVHIYRRNEGGVNGWEWVQTLVPPDGDGREFAQAIHAWGDRLAVIRPQHYHEYFNLATCRGRTLFMYRRNGSGNWDLEATIGGGIIADIGCPSLERVVMGAREGHLASSERNYAQGAIDVVAWSLGSQGWTSSSSDWGAFMNAAMPFVGFSGDTLVTFKGPDLVLADLEANCLDTLLLPELQYQIGEQGMPIDVHDELLALGVPWRLVEPFLTDTLGMVVIHDLSMIDHPELFRVEPDVPTVSFGQTVKLADRQLIVLEGADGHVPRIFVYEVDPEGGSHEARQVIEPGFGHLRSTRQLHVSGTGEFIFSAWPFEQSGNLGDPNRVMVYYDPTVMSGMVSSGAVPARFTASCDGDRIVLTAHGQDVEARGTVEVYDVLGALVGTADLATAMGQGVRVGASASAALLLHIREDGEHYMIRVIRWNDR